MMDNPTPPPAPQPTSPAPTPPWLLDQLRQTARQRGYPEPAVAAMAEWCRCFMLFHHKRHPRDLGAAEVEQFLTHLAVARPVWASTQNQALNALVFLYKQVLEMEVGRLDAVRARRGKHFPVVLAASCASRMSSRRVGRSWFAEARATRTAWSCCPDRCATTWNCNSIGEEDSTSAGWPGSNCQTRWNGSTRVRRRNTAGSPANYSTA